MWGTDNSSETESRYDEDWAAAGGNFGHGHLSPTPTAIASAAEPLDGFPPVVRELPQSGQVASARAVPADARVATQHAAAAPAEDNGGDWFLYDANDGSSLSSEQTGFEYGIFSEVSDTWSDCSSSGGALL